MFVYRVLGLCLSLFVVTVSLAQTDLDSVNYLNEVHLVGSKDQDVIPAQQLSGEKLEALNSFSVADAIRYFSGVQIKDYGGVGGLKTVDIRSMGTNHMGVFYDGIQLGNAQNGQIDLGKFSLDNIEKISLYNGQKSEIFQPAKDFGSAGSIYLQTRRPQFEEGKRTNIRLFSRTGSFGLLNQSVLWEQKVSKKINSSFNAEYIQASGKYKFRYRKVLADGTVAWDTSAVRHNGDINSQRLEGGFNGFVKNGKWHLKSYFYNSERGIPGAIVNNIWTHSQRQWDRSFFTQGSFQKQVSKRYDLLLNAKYANDWMRYLNTDTTLMYIDNKFLQQEIYTSAANRYSILPNWDVNLSVDYQWNILNASLQDFVHPRRNTLLAALATAFEWKRLKAQASLLRTGVFEKVSRVQDRSGVALSKSETAAPERKQEYTPAFFVSYQPFVTSPKWSPLRLRVFYKRIFRMPTFNDLYYTDIGNVALRPEYTTQYNIGFQYNRSFKKGRVANLNIRTDGYYNTVQDKIIAVPKGNGQYRWMMMNIGYVKIHGIDVSGQVQWKLPYNAVLHTSLTYTHQRAQDFTDPKDNDPESGSYGGQIAYIPRHSGSVISNLIWKSWDLNYSFIYVGERYHNSSNIRENYEQPWYTHDLNLGKTFNYRKLNGKLSLEVNNILNQYYDVVLNYPMPGRNYKLILKVFI